MSTREPALSHDTPGAIELLAAARRHLADALLPGTTGEHRYSALMIANALSIVQAELESAGASSTLTSNRSAGEELCRQLRQGIVDDLFDETLLRRLKDDVHARLKVANPKRLDP